MYNKVVLRNLHGQYLKEQYQLKLDFLMIPLAVENWDNDSVLASLLNDA